MSAKAATRTDAGGSAGAGGFDYQARVAAWFAVQALAGAAAAGVRGLFAGSVQEIACETQAPIDDCLVRTADGTVLALQAKRSITLGTTERSELAKTVGQFVRQHLWSGHETDRLVLVTTSDASSVVTRDLAEVLERMRRAPAGADPATGFNAKQVRVHATFVGHVMREWRGAQPDTEPSDEQVRAFLAHCWVWVLDAEEGRDSEREALTLLRTAVVTDAAQADAAWDALLRVCTQLSKQKIGIDLAGLQRELTETSKVRLATIRDFREDVARLAALTRQTLEQMAGELTSIPGPQGDVNIRRNVDSVLTRRVARGSCLVTGEPGAGKSAAVHGLASTWVSAGRPVLFVQVSSLGAASAGQLQGELHLEHPLLEALEQWSPGSRGLLVLDALDAARADTASELWRLLIRQVHQRLPRWSVVASIRSWDLQHSVSLGSLIQDDAVVVGDFDDAEFAEITRSVVALAELEASCEEQVKRLLRNPFNLRLAAHLLLDGALPADLQAIDSRLDLLGRFWEHRITGAPGHSQRSVFIAEWCQSAVAARKLAVSAQPLLAGNTGAADVLHALLSDRVLMPASVSEIGVGSGLLGPMQFSHHVLFDYALAVAYFTTGDDGLAGRLGADPDALLFAHPSVDMYLELSWRQGPEMFWQLALRLAAPSLPRMATAAVAAVVVRCCRTTDALTPLLAQLAAGSPEARHLAHAVAVAVSLAVGNGAVGDLGTWCDWAEQLSQQPAAATGALLILVSDLTAIALTAPASQSCGHAARAVLAYLWTQPVSRQSWPAITAVIRTASGAPQTAGALLHQALQGEQLAERGHNDLFPLSQDVPRLMSCLASLVTDLYVAAMSYDETSTAATQLGSGSVLTLLSDRQKDYGAGRYELIRQFPGVVRHDLARALDILTRLSLLQGNTGAVHTGGLASRAVGVVADGSRLWDRPSFQRRDLTALLDAFEETVAAFSKSAQAERLLDALAAVPQAAVVWRRVLRAAAGNPVLAQELAAPAEALVASLGLPDLLGPLAGLVGAVHPTLDEQQASRLEAAVRALKDSSASAQGGVAWSWSDPYQLLVDALSPEPENQPGLGEDGSPGAVDGGDSDLAPAVPHADAVPGPVSAVDQRGLHLVGEVEEFVSAPRDGGPAVEAITAIEAVVRELFADIGLLSAAVQERAKLALAQAAELFTRPVGVPGPSLELAREVLLSMQAGPQAIAGSGHFSGVIPYDACGWAATGLMQLSRMDGQYTPAVQEAICALAEHPVNWVRICIVRGTGLLARADGETAWSLLERFADQESDPVLLCSTVQLACLGLGDPVRGVGLLSRVADRVDPDDGPASVSGLCAEITGYLWVATALAQASTVLAGLLSRWAGHGVWSRLLFNLRENDLLTHDDDAVRARAFTLVGQLAKPALGVLQQGLAASARPLDSDGQERLRDSVRLLDDIALGLCAASGATGSESTAPSLEQVRLVKEAGSVVALLENASVPSATHHLIQMYEHVFISMPQQALLAVRDLLTAPGAPTAYFSDSLALDLCVRLVERILADHQQLLRTPECLTAVRQICDVFVAAGWPRAHQLVFGIERAFR